MADIARLSGVSKPTVSRVMSGSSLVTEETRQRVLEIAREHGYWVNDNARRLWLNRANTIAVVLDLPSLPQRRVSEPFHFEILADLLHALTDARQDALVVGPSLETAEQFEELIASKRVDGVIFRWSGTTPEHLFETRKKRRAVRRLGRCRSFKSVRVGWQRQYWRRPPGCRSAPGARQKADTVRRSA